MKIEDLLTNFCISSNILQLFNVRDLANCQRLNKFFRGLITNHKCWVNYKLNYAKTMIKVQASLKKNGKQEKETAEFASVLDYVMTNETLENKKKFGDALNLYLRGDNFYHSPWTQLRKYFLNQGAQRIFVQNGTVSYEELQQYATNPSEMSKHFGRAKVIEYLLALRRTTCRRNVTDLSLDEDEMNTKLKHREMCQKQRKKKKSNKRNF